MSGSKIKTTLYAASVLPLKDEKLYRSAYNAVSLKRCQKVDNYKFENDKFLSLGAELLLRHGLHELNVNYEPIHIKTNSCGKPFIENTEVYYNISHSGNWVIYAISDVEIGCDIEKIQPVELKIAKRYFCPEEYMHISAQPSEAERTLLFYRYWTLKESFIKATGLGMTLPLNTFRIELGKHVQIHQSLDKRNYTFTEFEDISGYSCAVCTIQNKSEVKLEIIDLPLLITSL